MRQAMTLNTHICAEYKEMQAAGVSVFAFDAAGFGKSEPFEEQYRCFVPDVDYFADDVYAYRKVRPDMQTF
jgi:alpha-beta hydrolase superfamily lysophospholipase